MLFTPKILLTVFAILFVWSDLSSATILPSIRETVEGIRTEADFDWNATNMINNKNYFENDSNFFDHHSVNKSDYSFDSVAHDFLAAKKMFLNSEKNGKTRKFINSIRNAGHNEYNLFGDTFSYSLDANDTVTGMGGETGNLNEKFEIYGGATGRSMNVTMQFRTKAEKEQWGQHDHDVGHSNESVIGHSPLVSNIMRLHGMGIQDASTDGRIKTNPFALEATYTQEDFDATYSLTEFEELINGCLFLGWLNTSLDGNINLVTNADRWVHAVQGNFDNMPDNPNRHDEHGVIGNAIVGSLQSYIDGTTTSIQGLTKAQGEIRVGDHGGDPNGNTVWAIIDHNSDFVVVPEPSTYALIGGVISLATVILRRRK